MKKSIVWVALGSLLLASCTTDTYTTEEEQMVTNQNVTDLINRLVAKQQNQAKGAQQKSTTSLQDLINQIEAIALQDTSFLQLVTTNYSTPQAVAIDAIVTDIDGAFANLNATTKVKNYTNTLLNAHTVTDLNQLEQTITFDTQLTSDEKNLLLDVIDLQKQNVLGNGNGEEDGDDKDWYKRRIIGYMQGATQTKANAVLNTVVIQVLSGN